MEKISPPHTARKMGQGPGVGRGEWRGGPLPTPRPLPTLRGQGGVFCRPLSGVSLVPAAPARRTLPNFRGQRVVDPGGETEVQTRGGYWSKGEGGGGG